MDPISPPSSPDYQIPSHQELLDFWDPILSTPTGASAGITTAPSDPSQSGLPLPEDSDSDDFDIKSESDDDEETHEDLVAFWRPLLSTPTGPSASAALAPSPSSPSGIPLPEGPDFDDFDIKWTAFESDSDSDCEGLTHEQTAAFWGGLLPGSTSFNVHGPLLSNKDDSDDSDFESEVDDEEMEDIALDEAFEFAEDEDDEPREFLDEPRKLAEEKKMKEEAAKEKWSKLKLPQLKEECEKHGLAKSGLKAWLVERLVEDDLENELEMDC